MPYGMTPEWVAGAQQGIQRSMARRQMLQTLQAEDAQEKDRLKKLEEEATRYREEAKLLGMPKAEAEALSVGQAKGFVEAQRLQQKERIAKQTENQMARDLRAAATTSKTSGQLTPAEAKYLMERIGITDPQAAMAQWDSLGLLQRAQVLDIKSDKVRTDLEKMEDNQRQAAELNMRRKEAEVREGSTKVNVEQMKAQTAATTENQRRQKAREEAAASDLKYYGGSKEPVYRRGPGGVVSAHTPGDVDEDGSPRWTHQRSEGPREGMLRDAMQQALGSQTETPAQGKAVVGKAPVKVTTDEEYNALPSGAFYIGPDGKKRRKQ